MIIKILIIIMMISSNEGNCAETKNDVFNKLIEGYKALSLDEKVSIYSKLIEAIPASTKRKTQIPIKEDLCRALISENENEVFMRLLSNDSIKDVKSKRAIWGVAASTKDIRARQHLEIILESEKSDEKIIAIRLLSFYFNDNAQVFSKLEKISKSEANIDVLYELVNSMQYYDCLKAIKIVSSFVDDNRAPSATTNSPPTDVFTLSTEAKRILEKCRSSESDNRDTFKPR